MKFLNALEFAQYLRMEGNEWADEIINALEFEQNSRHSEIVDDIRYHAPDHLKEDTVRSVEWLGDRSNLLDELQDTLDKNGFEGVDIDDALEELLKRPKPLEYDL